MDETKTTNNNSKLSEDKIREIERVTKLFNEQAVDLDMPIFQKIEDIRRLYGTPGFILKVEAQQSLKFSKELFTRIFILRDKLCAIKYHLDNMARLATEHKKAMSKFARLFGASSYVIHSADKIRYEFESFQFQFRSTLDLLAHIIYLLYGENKLRSPLKNLYKDREKPYFKNKYLVDDIFKLFDDNSWIADFLSSGAAKSYRDCATHYPWLLKYDYAEAKYENENFKYKTIKEEEGRDLLDYCSTYFNNICGLINIFFELVFQTEKIKDPNY